MTEELKRIDGYWLLLLALIAYGLIYCGQTIQSLDPTTVTVIVKPSEYVVYDEDIK